MAIGVKTDLVIYDNLFYGGMLDVMGQNVNVFNAASNGTIVLENKLATGDYIKESFLDYIDLTFDRDPASTAGLTSYAYTADEFVKPKVNKRFGPIENTLDSWKKFGLTSEDISFRLGQLFGQEKIKEQVNTALYAGVGAHLSQSGLLLDVTGQTVKTPGYAYLAQMFAKRGDHAQEIDALVMHSKSYFDIMQGAIADKVDSVYGAVVYAGTAATLGRPVIVVDSPALVSSTTYYILGLSKNAITITESEQDTIEAQKILGLANITFKVQGEFAYNVGVKGFGYDTTKNANPSNATLATTSSWLLKVADVKNAAGVIMKCN